jgi:hypothetical protein
MSLRMVGLALVASSWLMLAPQAKGQCLGCMVRSIETDFCRRNCWPEPFVIPDRASVREPFMISIANGWERQNLLLDQYFDDNGTRLNEAAKLKIRWIMLEGPSQHRMIYVRRSVNPQETTARVVAVRNYALQLAQGQPIPPIIESNANVEGMPAERVDAINRKFLQSMPPPVLLKSGGSGGGGGGSGGGSGGNSP